MGVVKITSSTWWPSLVTNGWSPPNGPAVPNDGLLHTWSENHIQWWSTFVNVSVSAVQQVFEFCKFDYWVWVLIMRAPLHPLGTNRLSLQQCLSSFPEIICASLHKHGIRNHISEATELSLLTLLTRTGIEPSTPVRYLSFPVMKASLSADLTITCINRGEHGLKFKVHKLFQICKRIYYCCLHVQMMPDQKLMCALTLKTLLKY